VAERFAPLVAEQRAALLGVLGHLSAEDWTRPTVCEGWTVKDVAAHLVEGELLFGRLYRGELGELNLDTQGGVDRWRRVDGETVRYSLWHHGQATQRVIDSRSDESWRRMVSAAGLELQLRHALRLHFFELAVHSHDLTSAVGAPAAWGDRAAVAADYCIRAAPAALAGSGTDRGGSIVVRAGGLPPRTLTSDDGGWRVLLDEAAAGDAAWETDAETLVLATTRRIDAGEALARSKVDGDAMLLREVLEAWWVTR